MRAKLRQGARLETLNGSKENIHANGITFIVYCKVQAYVILPSYLAHQKSQLTLLRKTNIHQDSPCTCAS